jgi:hypothetical protein
MARLRGPVGTAWVGTATRGRLDILGCKVLQTALRPAGGGTVALSSMSSPMCRSSSPVRQLGLRPRLLTAADSVLWSGWKIKEPGF